MPLTQDQVQTIISQAQAVSDAAKGPVAAKTKADADVTGLNTAKAAVAQAQAASDASQADEASQVNAVVTADAALSATLASLTAPATTASPTA